MHEDRLRGADASDLVGHTHLYQWKNWMHDRSQHLFLVEYKQLFDEGTPFVVSASASYYFLLVVPFHDVI